MTGAAASRARATHDKRLARAREALREVYGQRHAELAALARQIEFEETKARAASDAASAHPDDTVQDAFRLGELAGREAGLALACLLALEAVERERRS